MTIESLASGLGARISTTITGDQGTALVLQARARWKHEF
ncbi:uncharacterized protein with beta-barrel porin domain [Inquilinus ginsengisoli]|jgi:uncharacterized protein with beta-barrel porin domain|uniref:Uncharacterized protein with beta-barrel porin domain n=1 Tax=Inquilinus ginsengisoli TaxID=363840 RepID=A0ABU1JS95_9PROT|nr:uncharacterized protein with beta-barrel porin domain [Inquilinus ginsengisoli]